MLTIWSINSQAEQYVPGMVRTSRSVEKVTPSTSVPSIKDAHSEGKSGSSSFPFPNKLTKAYVGSQEESSKRELAVLAKQVMTSPTVSIGIKSPIADAWKLFYHHRFRHVPVVNDEDRIVGILSDRDLWREAAGIHQHTEIESVPLSSLTVQDIMVDRVLTAHPDTEIRTIARVMFEERIGALPIVNERGYPVGIITRSDILRTVMNQVPLELWI
ncbi:CBS domain-containing protein [Candidatus Nitronereus thalassa]|uniref:CBS domain-containing protein n=1 Tax=Candidatus Nitronereus thalassa TaxID=3020898 RepID=A0ABU3K8U8_9BACT|nr:CBS domain-containing protein [Candidatus Nitronereus thalassa]MDT7042813.1 CBS domain-containing protein [Candidatus Nitronereus thalassa]